ncbi:MAG: DUF3341 domain-containing protein [Desulfosporosinus sp.]|nr:DUF3341 domain-containing protein [Desulfosporosinus sp.]
MEKKVIGYFADSNQAGQAANELKAQGFKDISVLGNESGGKEESMGKDNSSNNTMTGGVIGGLAGLGLGTGALGALGAAALLIPGVGPIVAMGPLAAALGGAVTGGVAGALIDYGIPKERSDFYESKIKEGNTVLVLKADEQKTDEVAKMMKNHGAKDVRVH